MVLMVELVNTVEWFSSIAKACRFDSGSGHPSITNDIMNVTLEPSESKSIREFASGWTKLAEANRELNQTSSYMSDIHVVNAVIKPTFPRSLKMRRKKKIMINKAVASLRDPRTAVYKNCYPVSMKEVSSDQSSLVTFDVTFEFDKTA